MVQPKKIQELMVDIFDFPHIPYWFTIRQAIGIVRVARISGKKCPEPMTVLVFDEKYCLLGTIGLGDILRGVEAKFLQTEAQGGVFPEDESGMAGLWAALSSVDGKALAERPVKDVMHPANVSVAPEDPAAKAAYLMIRHSLTVLPVQESSKKLVGLIRMEELFDSLTSTLLQA